MTIETKFEIGQKVFIKDINMGGVVQSYYYLNRVEYRVRYFDAGQIHDPYFLESELSAIEEDK